MELSVAFGPLESWPDQDLIAWSSEFDAGLVLEAYCAGVFPMPLHEAGWAPRTMGWWSPVHRGILPPDDLRVSRSLRKSARRYAVTVDAAFGDVLARCADPDRPDGWIDGRVREVYTELHRAGVVHSVEAWTAEGDLAGGLYGVGLGGLFAGESMFHDPGIGRDASKVALMRLVDLLDDGVPDRLLDVQWVTPHLGGLGAVEIDRVDYLRLLGDALRLPPAGWAAARQVTWRSPSPA